jgi:hypothetical protein
MPASGTYNTPVNGPQGCVANRFFRTPRRAPGVPHPPACKQADTRTVEYGLLGPDVKSVTYTSGGRGSRTVPTVGPEGAYLIVLPAKKGRPDGVVTGPTPGGGVVTTITKRDGSVCQLPAPGSPRPHPRAACERLGYQPAAGQLPTRSEVQAQVRVRVTPSPDPGLRPEAEVSFTARVPVTNAHSAYRIMWTPGPQAGTREWIDTERDIRAGATVRQRFEDRRPGLYHVSVRYVTADAKPLAPPRASGTLVGRLTIRIPSSRPGG